MATVLGVVSQCPTPKVFAAESDVTVVDLTDFYTGIEIGHNCKDYLKSAYDANNHWSECGVCGERYIISPHNLITTGKETCRTNFAKRRSFCTDGCGYSKELPHLEHGEPVLVGYENAHCHHSVCSICGEDATFWQPCKDANGNLLGCQTTGTCVDCGINYTQLKHAFAIGVGTNCYACGQELFRVEMNAEVMGETTTRCTWVLTPTTNAIPALIDAFGTCAGVGDQLEISNKKYYEAEGKYYYIADFSSTANSQWTTTETHWYGHYSQNGMMTGEHTAMSIKAENYAPVFNEVTVTGNGKDENYSKKASIYVNVSDGWISPINMVYMRLVDLNGNVLSDWGSTYRDGSTYTKNFDVVDEVIDEEKELIIEAKDACGNISEYRVQIFNLDSKAPIVIPQISSSNDWSNEKTITFSCTDNGVGNVEIAFNSTDDFRKANYINGTYERTYTFTGDVYGSVVGAVYYRDGAGNVTTQFVTISNLDQTQPKIECINILDAFDEKCEAIGWYIDIKANDNNDYIQQEGSRICYVALSTSDTYLDEAKYQNVEKIFVPKSGTYYIWLKDAAGNVTVSDSIHIYSDISFNGVKLRDCNYDGINIDGIYYNGVRVRL